MEIDEQEKAAELAEFERTLARLFVLNVVLMKKYGPEVVTAAMLRGNAAGMAAVGADAESIRNWTNASVHGLKEMVTKAKDGKR